MSVLDSAGASCPQAAELLGQLRGVLRGDDPVPMDVWQEEKEASALCKKERGRYLELVALLGAVETMLSDYQKCTRISAEEQQDLRAVMEGQNLWSAPEVYQSIDATLVAAQAAQKLGLPVLPHAQPPLQSTGDHSPATIFGLEAADVAPSGTPRQSVEAIPELERRLAQQCKWLEDVAGNHGRAAEGPARESPSIPGLIRARLDALSQKQQAEARLCTHTAQHFSSCFEELRRAQLHICDLVNRHHLDGSPGYVLARVGQLDAHCRTLLSKVETMQAQFLYKTYTAEGVRALSTVAGHIEGRQKEIQEQLSKVQSRLALYHENKEELLVIAQEHKALQDEITEAEFALGQLESLEM